MYNPVVVETLLEFFKITIDEELNSMVLDQFEGIRDRTKENLQKTMQQKPAL